MSLLLIYFIHSSLYLNPVPCLAPPFLFFFILLYFTLHYCIGFAIHQHESAMVKVLGAAPVGTSIVIPSGEVYLVTE